MNHFISRRLFCQSTLSLPLLPLGYANAASQSGLKPIEGSWFEFQHCHVHESGYWDATCAAFSCAQWQAKVAEMAELGMQYLVLLSVAQDGKAFYPSKQMPSWNLACADPLEAVLSEADRRGMKVFVSGGFFDEKIGTYADEAGTKQRFAAMEELVGLYGQHPSFYGWYWPNEASIDPYYHEVFIRYCNTSSAEARRLMPEAKILIAPYGTRLAKADAVYAKQLESLDVDFIAYQDEVGVRKTQPDELDAIYAHLRAVHDQVQRARLWADVEIFDFEGDTYKSNLIPAPFARVRQQLEAIAPHVDTILVYQYQGMMNKLGSSAFAGHPESPKLYAEYQEWRASRGFSP
ncbi:MAG: DUF4434 domain-containing protein [bacterium]|jgi:hypothetical protein|nr:DUF4434 domain-containing protein [bacterium]